MKYDPEKHHRRSIRLSGYDYAQAGIYFVTICTHDRLCLFGEIVDGKMQLNPFGNIAVSCWQEIPRHFTNAELDVFGVMPNHVHGIVMITGVTADVGVMHAGATHVGATHASPLPPRGPKRQSLGAIVGSYKSAVTKQINANRQTTRPVWQRNYYEHIIRNEKALDTIRQYIINNPALWGEDVNNPLKNVHPAHK